MGQDNCDVLGLGSECMTPLAPETIPMYETEMV